MSLSAEVSPCKANSEAADEPNEDAASKAGSDPDYDPFADCDSESPLTVSSFPESDLITDSVLQEEVTLEKQAETEEEEKIQHQKQLWLTLGEETKEQRYQRLQCLLMKSNMYTEYLMKRMERQREEETKRRRRIIKKREAEAKAKVEAVPAKTEHPSTADTNTDNNVSPSSEVRTQFQENQVLGSPSASQVLNDDNQSSQNSTSSTSSTRRRSKRCLPAPVPKSRLSTNNTPVSSPKVPKSPSPNLPSNKVKSEPQSESPKAQSLKDPSLSPTSDKENVDGNTKKDVQDASENKDKKINFTEETAATRAVWNVLGKQAENYKRKVDQVDTDELLKQILPPKKARKSEPEIPLFNGDPDIDEDGTIVRPALLTGGNLRKYQIEGLNWLKVLFENGVNGMLADEMGLGKTIQCVALLCQIITMGATGPFMVVAPLSTLPNWKMEFKRFAPHLPVVFYHGSKDERTQLQKTIKKKHLIMKGVRIQPIVITSYEIAMKDRPDLQKFNWTYLIVDEGHRIKNKNCRLVRELKCYKNSHRLLLTGTPLQNNLSELWSLLNFLLPEIFDDLGSFETWFDVEMFSADGANEAIIEEEQQKNVLSMLHQILTPFMLRRVKSDVDLEIPPKKELLVYAPLSQVQKEFYETTLDKSIFEKFNPEEEEPEVELNASGRPKRGGKILNRKSDPSLEQNTEVKLTLNNIMMQLRKVCNHPYLIEYPLDPFGNYKMDEDLVDKCGKMMVLDKMVPELRQRGHKILIFSQMTRMMDILEDYLCIRKMKYCRLDGSCKIQDRQDSMEKFNTDPEIGVFLLSTRAGGLGVNLVAADTVIIYDSDWNPQCDLQAQDRCHRIGQTKPVVVYRFVTANTVDEKIVERAAGKRKLEKVIIHKGKFKSGINKEFTSEVKPLNPEELLELLKSTDHSAIVHKGKEEAISNKELEELLDRSDLIAEFEASKKEAKSKKN